MKKVAVTALTLSALTLSAASVMDKAKEAGLMPIPNSKAALNKLIETKENPLTPEKIELGKKLYFEPRLSKSGLISCNTCHNLGAGGVDGVSAAVGHGWAFNPHHLNSPTVYNAVFNVVQFWDGRDATLEAQAKGPIQNPVEMAILDKDVEKVLNSIPAYKKEFQSVFKSKGNVTFDQVALAIAAFERTLVTPSRFDKFMNGNKKSLTDKEQKGLQTFIDKGCTTCHNGIGIGGGMMQPFPLMGKYKYENVGDFKGNKDGLIKVPTLRNITQTAPYFHNGMVWNLKEAIQIMGETQLGMKISDKEAESIEAFLATLEGEKPEVTYPQLPTSTAATPHPKPELDIK